MGQILIPVQVDKKSAKKIDKLAKIELRSRAQMTRVLLLDALSKKVSKNEP